MNARDRAARELDRWRKALQAAKTLLSAGLSEDCVSRAYYAVLHAAKAALALNGLHPQSHQAVRSMFGPHLVKPGLLEREFARILTAKQEDRELGDYDIDTTIDADRASLRADEPERFVQRIEAYMAKSG